MRLVRLTPLALAVIGYLVFSLIRWSHLDTGGYDLGIFDQTVWHYSRFELPANSVKGYANVWGDHFSPILAILAPLYWVWDDARMLLVAQAVLLAAAAVPIFLYARDRVGRRPAYLLAASYLVFWGVQSALNTDFHELAFAPVLLASLLLAFDRRRWRLFFGLVVALLCVKEDQSIVVVFLGLYLLTFRLWGPGLAVIALGVAWYVLVVKLLIPHYAPDGEYAYFHYERFGGDPLSAIKGAIGHPVRVVETLFGNDTKRTTLAYLFVPFLALPLFSRTAILMAPLIAQRFLSETPDYWGRGGQYTLAIAALLFVGTADSAARVRRFALPLTAVVLALNLTATLSLDRPGGARPGIASAKRAVAVVPSGVSVATTDNLIVRLAHRKLAAEISPETGPTDYVVAEVFDSGRNLIANSGFPAVSKYLDAQLATHVPIFYEDGFLVLRARRLGPAPRVLPQLADAARLRGVATAWGATLASAPSPAFRGQAASLAAELARGRPEGGCRKLRDAAAYVTSTFAAELERTRVNGGAGTGERLKGQRDFFSATDRAGYLVRYVALCA